MRRSSIRIRLLIVSIVFSVALVGIVLSVAYVVITAAMSRTAETTTLRMTAPAALRIRAIVTRAEAGTDAGLRPEERRADAMREVVRELEHLTASGEFAEGELALYEVGGELVWSSDSRAVLDGMAGQRAAALAGTGTAGVSRDRGRALSGLAGAADMGAYAIHVPVDLPVGSRGVMDVVYVPAREEAIVDAVRMPMLLLGLMAAVASIAIMQLGTRWVLALVKNLTAAADHIQGGDLEVQLPVHGDNEIGDLARSINNLLGRLRRRADSQTRFVADASHELATPVAGIRGYVNILRVWGSEDPELRDEAIRAIDRESRRMARLCAELLSLIRGDREIELRSVRFDINARCREVLADAATRHMGKQLEFIGPGEGQLVLHGDPDRIEEVVSILVDNAAKYTPVGGQVSVATRRRREQAVIEVSDTGPGISEEDLPHIFDRFYRSDASRSQETGGFGLGLAIAKRIVEAAGGTIEVHSVLDVGTTFIVRLPRANE